MPDIHLELLIGAPAQSVYHAITTSEGLSAWWTPGTKAEPEINSIAHFPFGSDYIKEMRITDLQPFKQVSWDCIAGEGEWIETSISFELETNDKNQLLGSHPELADQVNQQAASGAQTLLVFYHSNWKQDTAMFGECSYTWALFLRSLKLYCETGRGRPWPNQHAI
jgi:uncharacterized protein YndB with AHSA1/START domain